MEGGFWGTGDLGVIGRHTFSLDVSRYSLEGSFVDGGVVLGDRDHCLSYAAASELVA